MDSPENRKNTVITSRWRIIGITTSILLVAVVGVVIWLSIRTGETEAANALLQTTQYTAAQTEPDVTYPEMIELPIQRIGDHIFSAKSIHTVDDETKSIVPTTINGVRMHRHNLTEVSHIEGLQGQVAVSNMNLRTGRALDVRALLEILAGGTLTPNKFVRTDETGALSTTELYRHLSVSERHLVLTVQEDGDVHLALPQVLDRSEEHTSELQSH